MKEIEDGLNIKLNSFYEKIHQIKLFNLVGKNFNLDLKTKQGSINGSKKSKF